MYKTNISPEDGLRLDQYIKAVSKGNSRISAKKEIELIKEYRGSNARKSAKALDTLLSYNISIFADIAINVLNNMKGGANIDPLDLMQVATITFIKKLKTWDISKKTKMITYYYREVKTQMQRYIMSNAFAIRQGSVYLQHLAYNISQYKNDIRNDLDINPSPERIAEDLGISLSTVRLCLRATSADIVSLDEDPDVYVHTTDLPSNFPLLNILEKTLSRFDIDADGVTTILEVFQGYSEELPQELLDKLK